MCVCVCVAPEQAPNEVSTVRQHYNTVIAQALIYPVQMSQLLYSVRYISEITLDKIETLESSLNDKKITLYDAISTAVSSDDQKFEVLATILSKCEDLRLLGNNIHCEYGK